MTMPQRTPMPRHAQDELAGWQEIGRMWSLSFCLEDPYARCQACDQAVIRLADDEGRWYVYTPDEALVLVVAHIRQVHDAKPQVAL